MRFRFSLRAAFLALAICALPCAWYSAAASGRAAEQRALAKLRRSTGGLVIVTDGKHPFGGCSTYTGGIVYLDDCGPFFLRPLNLDVCKRVTVCNFQLDSCRDLFADLEPFANLRRFSVYLDDGRARPQSMADARIFQARHPQVEITMNHQPLTDAGK